MSKLSEMIATLCPNGVEYKKLGEVATIERGSGLQKSDFVAEGFPCIHYGQLYTRFNTVATSEFTYVSEKTAQGLKRLHNGDILMAVTSENVEDVCKCIAWLGEYDVAVGGHTAIIRHSQDAKYLAYWFQTEDFFRQKKKLAHGTKVIEVTPKRLEDVVIPLPPLPIQREIVQILDNFANLTAELTAELAKRKKQYEHYRDILFEPSTDTWARVTVEDIADTFVGLATSVTPYQRESGVLLIHNSDVQQNEIVLKQRVYLDDAFVRRNSKKLFQKDDIVTVHTGDVGTSAVISDEYVGCIGFTTLTTRIRDTTKVLPRYLAHYFNSHRCKQDIATKTISDRSNLNQSSFSRLSIPLPPLAEQKRIVAILDRFDSLCNSLTEGLPAEIALRKKQYEYYRDKLLSFKEAG